jgi:hypothetical protein
MILKQMCIWLVFIQFYIAIVVVVAAASSASAATTVIIVIVIAINVTIVFVVVVAVVDLYGPCHSRQQHSYGYVCVCLQGSWCYCQW